MMIPYFQQLGQRIEDAWLTHSYDEDIFPQLAQDELASRPPSEHVQVSEIVDWVFSAHQAFQQPDNSQLFGQPPVLVYQGPRFYIEALFWLSATTEIHEHAFSGAFTVLAGSSVHSHWAFDPERQINSRMKIGRLQRVTTEILTPGAIRQISSGDRLIHQLFHLELPSVSIVVRTYVDRHRLPQYRYMPPGLGVESRGQQATRTRRIMLLDGMAQGHLEGLEPAARQLIGRGDLETLYPMFQVLTARQIEPELLGALRTHARERHGEIVDLIFEVCEWERRTRLVVGLRSKFSEPEPRFLLALLMLMPDRASVFETIRLRYPGDDPLDLIDRWLEPMSGKEHIGFEVNSQSQALFRAVVEGLDEAEVLERMAERFDRESVESQAEGLLERARQMARSDLLYPLFSESPLRRTEPVKVDAA